VIAKAKDVIPGKPVRFVVAMHYHWDHMGGIRTAIDEGAIIVTHESNQELLQRIAMSPHTIKPDRLSKSMKPRRISRFNDDLKGKKSAAFMFQMNKIRKFRKETGAL
jgi:glyoxylase-like metal-dependent hydrolase (beta-lactamase superfamily II)